MNKKTDFRKKLDSGYFCPDYEEYPDLYDMEQIDEYIESGKAKAKEEIIEELGEGLIKITISNPSHPEGSEEMWVLRASAQEKLNKLKE